MIVLRIRLDGVSMDHRLERGRATLGSAARSTIRATSAGWPPLAATLVQDGSEVRMIVPGRVGTLTLRVGDEFKLGRADVTLVGLLLPDADEGAAGAPSGAGAAPAAAPRPAGVAAAAVAVTAPLFGEYEAAQPPSNAFVLAEPTAAATPPAPPVGTAAAQKPAPQVVASAASPISPTSATSPASPTTSASRPAPPKTKPSGPPKAPESISFDRQEDFGSELVAQIKRTPWFACSVAFHVLMFMVLRLVFTPTEPPQPPSRMVASTLLPTGRQTDEEQAQFDSTAPETLPESEVLPEEHPIPDETDPVPAVEPSILPGPLVMDEQPVPDMGTLPTLSAAGRRTASRPTSPKTSAPKVDLHEMFAKNSVKDATRRAAQHVRDQLGIDKGGPGDALKALVADDILVIEGAYDHQERVLTALQLPHNEISPFDPRIANGTAFDRPRFVFWNCGDPLNPRLVQRIAPRVRAYVEGGGYLFTSDWALDGIVKPAFPGYLDSHGTSEPLPEMIIEIAPTRSGSAHPLLEGVFQPGVNGRWWLEKVSHDILVKKPAEVTVLIESPQLRDLLNRSGVMACTFAFGKGRVLHLLGHYYQEEGNLAGAVAAQRIASNFVLMGLEPPK